MIKILRVALTLLTLCSAAYAQGIGQLNPGQVVGNPTASRAPGAPASLSAMFDRAFGTTPGTFITRGSSAWITAPSPLINTFGLTLYVSTTGDDGNDGLTPSTPMRHIAQAMIYLCKTFNLQGRNPQIQLADGTYVENIGRFGQCPNVGDGISITGNASDKTLVRILGANPGDTTAQARDMGILFLSNLTVGCAQTGGTGIAVSASQWGVIDFDNSEIIGCDNGVAFDSSDGGSLNIGTAVLSSNALRHFHVSGGASRMIIAGTITCDGIISSVNQNILVTEHGYADATAATWSGCGSYAGNSYFVDKGSRLIGAAAVPGVNGFVDGSTYGSIDGAYPVVTWTATDASGASLSITGTTNVQRSGHVCVVSFVLTYPATADGSTASIGGLPCAAQNSTVPYVGSQYGGVAGSVPRVSGNQATIQFIDVGTAASITNANLSGKTVRGTVTLSAQ